MMNQRMLNLSVHSILILAWESWDAKLSLWETKAHAEAVTVVEFTEPLLHVGILHILSIVDLLLTARTVPSTIVDTENRAVK